MRMETEMTTRPASRVRFPVGIAAAILTGALIVAATIAVLLRWTIVVGPTTGETTDHPIQGIYRLDRWTGSVMWCRPHGLPGLVAPTKVYCEAEN
jgi:hypothetical protein